MAAQRLNLAILLLVCLVLTLAGLRRLTGTPRLPQSSADLPTMIMPVEIVEPGKAIERCEIRVALRE
jgi:hypothetical protein